MRIKTGWEPFTRTMDGLKRSDSDVSAMTDRNDCHKMETYAITGRKFYNDV